METTESPAAGRHLDVPVSLDGDPPAHTAGVDVLDLAKFLRLVERHGARIERRLCTETERAALPADARGRALGVAGLFSAKESVLKALGGMPAGGCFHDIDTVARAAAPLEAGPIRVVLDGACAVEASARGIRVVAGVLDGPYDEAMLSWAVTTRVGVGADLDADTGWDRAGVPA